MTPDAAPAAPRPEPTPPTTLSNVTFSMEGLLTPTTTWGLSIVDANKTKTNVTVTGPTYHAPISATAGWCTFGVTPPAGYTLGLPLYGNGQFNAGGGPLVVPIFVHSPNAPSPTPIPRPGPSPSPTVTPAQARADFITAYGPSPSIQVTQAALTPAGQGGVVPTAGATYPLSIVPSITGGPYLGTGTGDLFDSGGILIQSGVFFGLVGNLGYATGQLPSGNSGWLIAFPYENNTVLLVLAAQPQGEAA